MAIYKYTKRYHTLPGIFVRADNENGRGVLGNRFKQLVTYRPWIFLMDETVGDQLRRAYRLPLAAVMFYIPNKEYLKNTFHKLFIYKAKQMNIWYT